MQRIRFKNINMKLSLAKPYMGGFVLKEIVNISTFLDEPELDNREIVKWEEVIGKVIIIEDAHFRKGTEGEYISLYFYFAEDKNKLPKCWNTSSHVVMNQIKPLKTNNILSKDNYWIKAKVVQRTTEKGLTYFTLIDPTEEE